LTAYLRPVYWAAIAVGGILSALLAFFGGSFLFRHARHVFCSGTWVVAEAFKTWFTAGASSSRAR
jgi:ABC-type branched-subunit amino acid transport system permease subunit